MNGGLTAKVLQDAEATELDNRVLGIVSKSSILEMQQSTKADIQNGRDDAHQRLDYQLLAKRGHLGMCECRREDLQLS